MFKTILAICQSLWSVLEIKNQVANIEVAETKSGRVSLQVQRIASLIRQFYVFYLLEVTIINISNSWDFLNEDLRFDLSITMS